MREFCPVFWGSHGCDLSPGHDGAHLCLLLYDPREPGPLWVWQDTGGWCNWWDGKEIGFLYDVCSMSS
jgi:hypothetical protein